MVNCEVASTLAAFMRDVVDPLARQKLGGSVTDIRVAASYDCRSRNNVPGAKMSEHAKGNAIDISAFKVKGEWIVVGGKNGLAQNAFLKEVRKAACGPFTTVLGPGSDAYHSDHFHLDLAQRGKPAAASIATEPSRPTGAKERSVKMSGARVLSDAFIPELPNHYRGKVRENYDLPDGRRIIIATDRLSAFDVILTSIPFKGQVLTETARYWFEQTADICPESRTRLPGPQRRHRHPARHPARRNRGARLSRRHHEHVDPDQVQARRARHVRHAPAGRPS